MGDLSIGDINAGETKTGTINHTIIESDYPGPLNNVAWATGKMANGTEIRSNDARWEVALGFEGNLIVSKSADVVYQNISKSINCTITVKNPNGFALKNLTVRTYHPSVIIVDVP